MIDVMSKVHPDDVPLGCYQVYWETGGSSSCVIAQDAKGRKYIHCANWTVVSGIKELNDHDGIIRMESLN